MKSKIDGNPGFPFEVNGESLDKLGETMERVADRGRALIDTGLRHWESEVERYYQEVSARARDTLDALGKCKSPLEVLEVEQRWLQAHAIDYFESGKRFARAFAEVARDAAKGNGADSAKA